VPAKAPIKPTDFWEVREEADPRFTVSLNPLLKWIPVGPRQHLPQFFFAAWDDPDSPFIVSFTFVTQSDGRVFCNDLGVKVRPEQKTQKPRTIARRDVTLASIRGIRIGEFKQRAARLAVAETRLEDGEWRVFHKALGDSIDSAALLADIEKHAHKPQRGKKLSDRFLREVAATYRKALAEGRPPTKAVCQAHFTVRANASRWVAEARKRGFLKPEDTYKPRGGKSRDN
jgi:hypothetical protein